MDQFHIDSMRFLLRVYGLPLGLMRNASELLIIKNAGLAARRSYVIHQTNNR